MRKRHLTILANDPSLTGWGYVVVRNDKVFAGGCIKTAPEHKKKRIRKTDDDLRRIHDINMELLLIIRSWNVNYIVSEIPHGSQTASGAVMVGTVRGIMQTIADCLEIPIETYSEQESKKTVLGKKTATKTEMVNAIGNVYDMPYVGVKYKDEAIADAMAIYHTAVKLSPTLKLLK
jgi:Holliday junction resolvasome RuvABC endonuclease subunit